MPRTPAKSPQTRSASKAKAEVVIGTPSGATANQSVASADEGQEATGAAASDAAPETESASVTPARKAAGKRKAAGSRPHEDETPSPKKSRVYVQESAVKVEIPVSAPTTKPSGKHIVFNDDEPSEVFTPQEGPAQDVLDGQTPKAEEDEDDEDEEDESDSEDDAPEAVSTHTSAAQAAKSAQAATKAAEKQQELEKRKRQDRDARFKKQAETRRKQQEKHQKKAVTAAADDDNNADPEHARREHHIPSLPSAATRKRLDKHSLPDVLPDDFLETASLGGDASADDSGDAGEGGRARKARFSTVSRQVAKAESRQPRDRRVGSTVYRVMKKQGDGRLAPRTGRYSRNAREMMMGRGRPAAKKAGFLVKEAVRGLADG
ncbi:hypothetical protein VM1G_00246 [Cytospora mali]|uniref:Uncharacterized protein n=1 Tax=Cytospora mali TaxID=578113 RepID=A0A194VLJ8_CYTMA|nr:hypothetical protein VM1G_00246 [Valsa mali]